MSTTSNRPETPDDTVAWREFLHELANLVDGSLRSVELAQRDLELDDGPDRAQRHLDTAGTGLGLIAELVRTMSEQLQGLSALAAKRVIDHPRALRDVVAQAVGLVGPLAGERSIAIHTDLEPGAARDHATPIFGAVLNALRNSVDAINHNGEIVVTGRIEVGSDGEEVVVEVCDDGPGPPTGRERERVFELGFSTKPGSGGIGLALARDALRGIGGSVSLGERWSDRARRRGAVLTMRYPLHWAQGRSAGAA